MPTIALDVAGPSFLAVIGGGLLVAVLWFVAVVLIEAVALTVLRWAKFRAALRASLVMNLTTTVVGFAIIGLLLSLPPLVWFLAAFVASVLLEWGVLEQTQRTKTPRRSLLISLVVNLCTYVPMGLILAPILTTF